MKTFLIGLAVVFGALLVLALFIAFPVDPGPPPPSGDCSDCSGPIIPVGYGLMGISTGAGGGPTLVKRIGPVGVYVDKGIRFANAG